MLPGGAGRGVAVSQTALPPDVRRFVTSRIHSVAQLEALLVVRGAPEQPWTPHELARRLYIGAHYAGVVLESLHLDGLLLERDGEYVYRPVSEALRRDVDALAQVYPRFLIQITEMIHAKYDAR